MLLGRNSKCWCGSGEKYKKCHMEFDEKLKEYAKAGYQVPTRDMIKNAEQIEKIKETKSLADRDRKKSWSARKLFTDPETIW